MAPAAGRQERSLGTLFSIVEADSLELELTVSDRDTLDELLSYPSGNSREQFALQALRIGVLALRQARGRVDADLIQRETQRMLTGLETQLAAHAAGLQTKLAGSLKEYFDPESGRFQERVQQLVREDGDLEQMLRRQIGGEDSQLAKTLLSHVGRDSPLVKLLDPNDKAGLRATLEATVEEQLDVQRQHVLREFSLDNKEGALARMVSELSASHGLLGEALQKKIDTVVAEFSLDKDDSALSRLVKNVDHAQRTITQEFSLDSERSALARLRGELVGILEKQTAASREFQEEVKVALGQMSARRQQAEQTTLCGVLFEDAVCQFLENHALASGDLVQRTGAMTGLIKNCKKGDCVLELSADSAAASARIVVEAKQDAAYTLSAARAEIETARKNRDAQVGLFIFASRTAPAGIEDFFKFGNDVFVRWNPEDPITNLFLRAGLTICKALCVRTGQTATAQAADFEAITKAILEVEKQSQALGEVTTSAETIKRGADTILDRVRKTRASLERQVESLQERVEEVKQLAQVQGDAGEV